jgi:hypothetical protein
MKTTFFSCLQKNFRFSLFRLTILFFLLPLSLSFMGCENQEKEKDYLQYQEEDSVYSLRVQQGDAEYGLTVCLINGKVELTFYKPSRLSGYRLLPTEESWELVCGGYRCPLLHPQLAETINQLFHLQAENLTEAKVETQSGQKITCLTFSDGTVVHLSEKGKPLRIQWEDWILSFTL